VNGEESGAKKRLRYTKPHRIRKQAKIRKEENITYVVADQREPSLMFTE
jgi:hypothetical protein